MDCDMCNGMGVIDRYGTHLYSIVCPECVGSGTLGEPIRKFEDTFSATELFVPKEREP
jgi:DnaJ-class molecular chaperone